MCARFHVTCMCVWAGLVPVSGVDSGLVQSQEVDGFCLVGPDVSLLSSSSV